MLSVVSRWRWQGDFRADRVRLSDAGAVVLDAKGRITLLDAGTGKAVWTRNVEDSVRDVAIASKGKEALALSVREVVRFGATGKAVWRSAPPPFPGRLAVRRDGAVFAIGAGQGLVRLLDAGTGRDLGGQRVRHAADHIALLAVDVVDARGASGPPATLTAVVAERGDVTLLDHLGQPHWTISLGATAGPPDAAHDRVVVPSFDGVHSFLLDGTPAGLYDVGAPTVRALLDDDAQRLLVLDARNRLFLLAAQTGETMWHLTLPDEAADVSFSGDGRAIAVALRGGAVEKLQVMDSATATVQSPFAETMPMAAAVSSPTGGFLEMAEDEALKVKPAPRWRVPAPAASPHVALAIVRSGEGVVMLDPANGELALWRGDQTPAWRATVGRGAQLGAAMTGDPIVVAGPGGVRFFSFDTGPIGTAQVDARELAVAESGGAVLVGSSTARLHLFDGAGKAVWDVPTPGFRRVAISPSGNELAIARDDGTVVFQLRGKKGGWTQSLGGTGFLNDDDDAPQTRDVEIRVLEEGVAFATAAGRAGFVLADGALALDTRVPNRRGAAAIVPVASEILLRDDGGGWCRFLRGPWRLESLPKAGGPGTSRFAIAMDRLLEFRYDSKEIASLDTSSGNVLWRRALGEAPKAVSVAPDGSSLAAVVSGELVLYDLVPAGSSVASGPDTQRFLEL